MNVGVVVIIFLLVLSFLGVPIFIALGIGTLVALHMADMALIVLPQKLFAGMNSSSLLAIPFFILAGSLMSRSITEKLINIANALIGQIKGKLGSGNCFVLYAVRCYLRFWCGDGLCHWWHYDPRNEKIGIPG